MDRRRQKLVVAIAREIENLSHEDWMDLASMTDSESIVRDHLSLDWPDIMVYHPTAHYEHTKHVIDSMIEQDDNNLKSILDFLELPEKMEKHDPKQYAELFGRTQLLVDEIRQKALYNSFDVTQYVMRIRAAVDDDPALAIGSTKELLESLMKYILSASGTSLAGNENFPKLLKLTQKTLKLDPTSFDKTKKGEDLVFRTLSNLGQLVTGIGEIRNEFGTGHGRAQPSGVWSRHARLVANAGAALAEFFIETFEYHEKSRN